MVTTHILMLLLALVYTAQAALDSNPRPATTVSTHTTPTQGSQVSERSEARDDTCPESCVCHSVTSDVTSPLSVTCPGPRLPTHLPPSTRQLSLSRCAALCESHGNASTTESPVGDDVMRDTGGSDVTGSDDPVSSKSNVTSQSTTREGATVTTYTELHNRTGLVTNGTKVNSDRYLVTRKPIYAENAQKQTQIQNTNNGSENTYTGATTKRKQFKTQVRDNSDMEDLFTLLGTVPQLQSLDLSCWEVDEEGDLWADSWPALPSLQQLTLRNTPLANQAPVFMRMAPRLQVLDMSYSSLTTFGLKLPSSRQLGYSAKQTPHQPTSDRDTNAATQQTVNSEQKGVASTHTTQSIPGHLHSSTTPAIMNKARFTASMTNTISPVTTTTPTYNSPSPTSVQTQTTTPSLKGPTKLPVINELRNNQEFQTARSGGITKHAAKPGENINPRFSVPSTHEPLLDNNTDLTNINQDLSDTGKHLKQQKRVIDQNEHISGFHIKSNTEPPTVFKHPSLHTLILAGNQLTTLSPELCSKLPNLTQLDVTGNQLDIVPHALSHCAMLRELNLSDNPIYTLASHALSGLVNLKTLRLSHLRVHALFKNSLAGPTGLTELDLSHNPYLHYIHADAFKHLQNLTTLNLKACNLSALHEGSLNIGANTQLLLEGNPWSCDCRLEWLITVVNTSSIRDQPMCAYPTELANMSWVEVSQKLQSGDINSTCVSPIVTSIVQTGTFAIASRGMLHCLLNVPSSAIITWITPRHERLIYDPTRVNFEEPEIDVPGFHSDHPWHSSGAWYKHALRGRLYLLHNGSLFIDYVTRVEGGVYRCLASNRHGNASASLRVYLDYSILSIHTWRAMLVGALGAAAFLVFGIIIGSLHALWRWFRIRHKEDANGRVRAMLSSLSDYRSAQLGRLSAKREQWSAYRCQQRERLTAYGSQQREKLQAYSAAKLDQLSAFTHNRRYRLHLGGLGSAVAQLANIREHYGEQMDALRTHCTGQAERLRTQYTQRLQRFRDYRSHQVGKLRGYKVEKVEQLRGSYTAQAHRLRESYSAQAGKLREYGSHQMARLRASYKLQQHYLLKLYELLGVGACLSTFEAECMRTESILFDDAFIRDLDSLHDFATEGYVLGDMAALRVDSDDDSYYVTASSQSDVSQSGRSESGHVAKKSREHKIRIEAVENYKSASVDLGTDEIQLIHEELHIEPFPPYLNFLEAIALHPNEPLPPHLNRFKHKKKMKKDSSKPATQPGISATQSFSIQIPSSVSNVPNTGEFCSRAEYKGSPGSCDEVRFSGLRDPTMSRGYKGLKRCDSQPPKSSPPLFHNEKETSSHKRGKFSYGPRVQRNSDSRLSSLKVCKLEATEKWFKGKDLKDTRQSAQNVLDNVSNVKNVGEKEATPLLGILRNVVSASGSMDSFCSINTPSRQSRNPDSIGTPARQSRDPDSLGTPSRQLRDPDSLGTPSRQLRDPDSLGTPARQSRDPDSLGTPSRQLRNPDSLGTPARQLRDPDSLGTPSRQLRYPDSPSTLVHSLMDPNSLGTPIHQYMDTDSQYQAIMEAQSSCSSSYHSGEDDNQQGPGSNLLI